MKKLGATLFLLLAVHATTGAVVSAQDSPSWFNATQPVHVSAIANEPFGKLEPYNAPCVNQTFNYYHFSQSLTEKEGTRTECVHQASYGEISVLGGLKYKNGTKAYKLYTSENPYNSRIYPIVNSRHVFSPSGGAGLNREYIYIYKDLPKRTSLYTYPGLDKQVFFKLTDPIVTSTNRVTFNNSEAPPVDPGSMSYASNGMFMLGNSVDYQTIINASTLKARKFGFKTPSYSGAYPKVNTALSADGALAFVSISDGLDARLYNLDQCSGANDGSVIENCQMTNLYTTLKTKLPSLKHIIRAQFTTNDTLYFKAKVSTTNGTSEAWYKVTLQQPDQNQVEYLALGDSFASGEGAYNYKLGTDQAGNSCHTSLNSYGYLIKSQLSFTNSETIACSGAKQKDITSSHGSEYKDDSPQSTGKIGDQYNQEILDQFLPGYRRQIDFVKKHKPKAITLSIGGNDIGFGKKLRECVLGPYNCFDSQPQKTSILSEIKAQLPELTKTYTALKNASPETRIYVVGYPSFAKPDGSCAWSVRLSNEEIKLSEAIVSDLNYVIETAAKKAGVFYVHAASALHGHRMCETSTSNTGFNGVTLGDDSGIFGFKFIGSESYHPNKLGHQLLAEKILSSTSSLTAPMPVADESADLHTMPSKLKSDPNTLDVPLPIPFLKESNEVIKRGTTILLDALVNSWLVPGSSFRVEIHSQPQQIGIAAAKDQETMALNAQIPEDIEPGAHTLHVIGLDGAGEPVDFYKHIIVIVDDTDADGDGIKNQNDSCPFLTPDKSSNSEEHFCLATQSQEEPTAPTEAAPVDPIKPRASSSENNSLTSPLDAPPLGGGEASTTTHSLSRHLGSVTTPLAKLFSTNPPSTLKPKNTHFKESNHHPQTRNWKKYLLMIGVGSSAGVAILLSYRRIR